MFISCSIASQTLLVGKVIDAETNQPLVNVNVTHNSNKSIITTDEKGYFKLQIDTIANNIIKLTKKGYETKSALIARNSGDTITIVLQPKTVYLPTIEVGADLKNKFDEIQSEAYTIKRADYQQSLGNTLAITLKNQIGMTMSSMGPSPARPVFRGFGGNRITIMNNGVNISDMSATSPDHALTIDPHSIEKVELVRGPKILLYTSSTTGAAIDAQNSYYTIPERFCARGLLFGESVNKGYAGMLLAKIPIDNYVLSGNVAYHNSQDLISKDKQIDNTYNKIIDMNYLGLAKFKNNVTNLHFENYQNSYGIPGGFIGAHPQGVDIQISKNVLTINSIWHFHKPWLDNISLLVNRNYYNHIEKEKNKSVGSEFVFRDYGVKAILNHNQNQIFDNGSFGIGFNYKDFKIGGYVFTPPTVLNNIYVFAYEEYQLLGFDLQTALRTEYSVFNPKIKQSMNNPAIKRDFMSLSGSLSVIKELNTNFAIGMNLSKTSRIPSIEELYSDGPHLAAYSYEIGNSKLKTENGLGIELFGFFKNSFMIFSLSSYLYNYDYYIIPRNTGKINVQQILPIYQTMGVKSIITGFESQTELNIIKNLIFKGNIAYTTGKITETNSYLPAIPPLRINLELKHRINSFSSGVQLEIAADQTKIDEFEEKTYGYIVSNVFIQKFAYVNGSIFSFILSVDNIFDTLYRNHLSRIKSIYPEPGRNFRILIKFDY